MHHIFGEILDQMHNPKLHPTLPDLFPNLLNFDTTVRQAIYMPETYREFYQLLRLLLLGYS